MTEGVRAKPVHIAYVVRDYMGEGGKPDSSWSEIGVTFMHKDGLGFDLILTAVPVNGRVVLRTIVDKEMKDFLKSLKPS